MSTAITILTLVHVAISLVAIAAGFLVAYGFLTAKRLNVLNVVFLATTVLTSATGFLFPISQVTPGLVIGIVSLMVLAAAIVARFRFHLAGRWRATYVITSLLAFYLNVFVLIVQLFQKVPVLHAMAPTQSEWPFAVTHVLVLAAFVAAGIGGVIRSRGISLSPPSATA